MCSADVLVNVVVLSIVTGYVVLGSIMGVPWPDLGAGSILHCPLVVLMFASDTAVSSLVGVTETCSWYLICCFGI